MVEDVVSQVDHIELSAKVGRLLNALGHEGGDGARVISMGHDEILAGLDRFLT